MTDFQANPRTPATMVSGTRGPENVVSQRVIADVQDEIALYMPSASPLMSLTSKLRKKRQATQYRFDWLEKDEYPRQVALSAAVAAGNTSLVLNAGEGARIAPNYVLLNVRTRESFLVTVVATDTLTVVSLTSGAASSVDQNAGDALVFTRAVYEDGVGIGTLKSIQEVDQFNYCEIIRTPFGFTGRQMNTDLYGGRDPVTEKKFFGIEHAKSIEKALMFGRRFSRTGASGHIQSFMGGVEFFISSNIWNLNGNVPSERAFVEFLEEGMRWGRGGNQDGSGTKYLFASSRWVTELEFWAKDKLQYRVLDEQLGLKAMEYVSAHGRVMILKDPILDYNHPDMALLLDLNHLRYVAHQGRDTKLLDNRQANDSDTEQFEYFSDISLQVELEAAHAILKGLP